MSAYTRAYQGLVRGGMTPNEAARVLADLRQDTGTELGTALRVHAAEQYAPAPADSRAIHRRKKAQFGAMCRGADWITTAAAGPSTTIPAQRNTGSTT
ncbi:hypothetical protein GCM10011583_11450 [Streptomyces camponoticapitis]|uniref:Uncharacterized protein n=1 Tax=Streptomyces camponoticapitis TaxID=1616125 RepID=A0ABQ2E144_9ACTN|nr:hypothetical protein [Streptomyces camponoticapitis]GGJ81690.1 hypothetical protein GCM10011583_11450 [Streptomyces camponoticapitis]